MNVIFCHNKRELVLTNTKKNRVFPARSEVRNALNGLRSLDNPKDVVYTTLTDRYAQKYPMMPRPFTRGTYYITGVEATQEKWLEPYIIKTSFSPMVEAWSLDENNCYDKPTGLFVKDEGYFIHYTPGDYTLGCIQVISRTDICIIYKEIGKELLEHGVLRLDVIA